MSMAFVLLVKIGMQPRPQEVAEGLSKCTSEELLAKYDAVGENRLEKVYSLYLLNHISKNCLEEEVELSIYNNSNSDIVNVIKADLFSSTNPDVSKKYKESACKSHKSSYSCKVLTMRQQEKVEEIDESAPLYSKIILSEILYKKGQFGDLEKVLDAIPNNEIIKDFKVSYAAKLSWETVKNKNPIFELVNETSSKAEKKYFDMWSCNKFMQEGCSFKDSTSCSSFRSIASVQKKDKKLYELTKLSINACEGNFEDRYTERDVEKLKQILMLNKSKKMKSLLGLIIKSGHSEAVKLHAANYYINFSENEEDLAPVYIYWMSSNHNLSWKNIGESIYRKYYGFSSHEKLVGISKAIDAVFPSDLSEKRIALSELLVNQPAQAERGLASTDPAIEVLKRDVL